MRLAWFSPWPPQRSGIAGRSAELAAALAARGHRIDVFVDEQDPAVRPLVVKAPPEPPQVREIRVQSAHDFVWRVARNQYDLCVYQLGNSRLHEFIWPYLFRWPGLALLHDARLHHARGRALLGRGRLDDFREEFAWSHEGASVDLAELAVRGFRGPYYYQWPMTRAIVESSRVTACHSRGATAELREQFPDRTIEYVALGEGSWRYDVDMMRRRFRAAHRLDSSAIVLGVHGALTAEKRVPEILRAFAATRPLQGGAILLLAGQPDPQLHLDHEISALGLGDAVRVVTNLDDAEFDGAIAATDVCLNLRWPTARETSGPWVRSLAMSRATVIVDLAHQHGIPVLDPRTWRRHTPCEDVVHDADTRAIAVAIDILDEEHSLRLAIRRLMADEALRLQLGHHGRAYWEREHTMVRMIADFERAAVRAVARPAPASTLPAHLRPDPQAHANELLKPFGLNHEGHEEHEGLAGPQ
jgi:glycosyltransferase involved in cell wall biosynthesis